MHSTTLALERIARANSCTSTEFLINRAIEDICITEDQLILLSPPPPPGVWIFDSRSLLGGLERQLAGRDLESGQRKHGPYEADSDYPETDAQEGEACGRGEYDAADEIKKLELQLQLAKLKSKKSSKR